MTKCKSCGKPIIWVKTPSGRSMPCDPELVPYCAVPKAKDKIVTPAGSVLSCEYKEDGQGATGLGYIPHWATCPNADAHRKKSEEQLRLF